MTGGRLPNVKELQSLIYFGQWNPALPPGHPFSGVLSFAYWTDHDGSQAYSWQPPCAPAQATRV